MGTVAKQKKKVPELRFPYFHDAWNKTTLGKVSCNVAYGMGASAKDFDGRNIYIRITDIDEKTGKLLRTNLTSPSIVPTLEYKVNENDILFARTGASTGKSYLYDPSDGQMYFAGFLIRFNIDKANSNFIYLVLQHSEYKKWVLMTSMRSGQPGINANEYKRYSFSLPELPEQQKIADFLGSVDAWLDNLRKQKTALENYKRGTMQKLFTQKIRFKDDNGKDFPKWQEKKLSDVSFKSNTGVSAGSLEGNDGEYAVYGASGLYKHVDFYQEEQPYIAIIKDGSGVGRTAVYPGKSSVIGTLNVIKATAGNDLYFVYLLFIKLNLLKYVIGGAIPHIYYKDYKREKVMVPSLPEQKKIANFLTSIDQTIATKAKEITKVEQWKKGLMQKMFV